MHQSTAVLFDQLTGRYYEHGKPWATKKASADIAALECEAVGLAMEHFAHHFAQAKGELVVLSDSTAAEGALKRTRSSSYAMNTAVKNSIVAINRHARDWVVKIAHVATDAQMADKASRMKSVSPDELASVLGVQLGEVAALSALPVYVPSLSAKDVDLICSSHAG